MHGKEKDQHHADPEARQRDAQKRACHDGAADPALRVCPGIDAKRNGYGQRECHGDQYHFDSCGETLKDQRHRRLAEDVGIPEISLHKA